MTPKQRPRKTPAGWSGSIEWPLGVPVGSGAGVTSMEGKRMLVLCRKTDEAIIIGEDITVVVTKIDGGRVWLGIDAPQTAVILREEIADKPQKEG